VLASALAMGTRCEVCLRVRQVLAGRYAGTSYRPCVKTVCKAVWLPQLVLESAPKTEPLTVCRRVQVTAPAANQQECCIDLSIHEQLYCVVIHVDSSGDRILALMPSHAAGCASNEFYDRQDRHLVSSSSGCKVGDVPFMSKLPRRHLPAHGLVRLFVCSALALTMALQVDAALGVPFVTIYQTLNS
jgi:hypothetical protein